MTAATTKASAERVILFFASLRCPDNGIRDSRVVSEVGASVLVSCVDTVVVVVMSITQSAVPGRW